MKRYPQLGPAQIFDALAFATEVSIEQQGIPDEIPLEACYLGWQESLRKLAKLIEPDIRE
jgi:hypothetical protein